MREIEDWLEAHGVDTSENGLRCGDGCSLDELEYGFDITDQICAKLEGGALPRECGSNDCLYIRDGVCIFTMIQGRDPEITEEDGCKDYACTSL